MYSIKSSFCSLPTQLMSTIPAVMSPIVDVVIAHADVAILANCWPI